MEQNMIVIIVLIIVSRIDSARILAVYPTSSISHQIVFRPLTQELVNRGHEVVVMTTDPAFPPDKAPANLTEIDIRSNSYKIWQQSFLTPLIGKHISMYKQVEIYTKVSALIFENQIKTKSIQNMLKADNNITFDLVIIESCCRPALAFSHVYKAPVILISSLGLTLGMNRILGLPTHPILYPILRSQRLYNLTYWEKIKSVFGNYLIDYILDSYEHEENEMLKKYFGPDTPSLSTLYNNVDMFFQNTYPILTDNTPVPPNVIYIGGLHQKTVKELPQDLKSYLDKSKNGVIYVSFGTNAKSSFLLPEKVQMMFNVFNKLPYDVLWKMDTKEFSGMSKKIIISNWFPQADLLRHKNVKVFIMQGGLQSTDEAISAGVPLIGIPMVSDQWYNTEKYIKLNIGLQLDWITLTEEKFRSAIIRIAEDISYRKSIRKLRTIINDEPQTPMERAIWWIEYILRHGGAKHLRAPAANMSWAEYYELDLFVILLISLILTLFALYLFIKYVRINVVKFLRSVKVKTF